MAKVGRVIVVVLCFAGVGWGQEYSIDRPAYPSSTPVHLTAPVTGRVEVYPGAEPLPVRVVGGQLEGPLQVEGTVGLRTDQVVSVEVANPTPWPERMQVEGTVRIEDDRPVRVWVANPPEPAPSSPASPSRETGRFTAFVVRGAFEARQTRVRVDLFPPEGKVFEAVGVTVDTRSDAALRVRLLARAGAVDGGVVGGGGDPVPFALVDGDLGSPATLPVPVPLTGPFMVEAETPAPGLGAPFTVVVTGRVRER